MTSMTPPESRPSSPTWSTDGESLVSWRPGDEGPSRSTIRQRRSSRKLSLGISSPRIRPSRPLPKPPSVTTRPRGQSSPSPRPAQSSSHPPPSPIHSALHLIAPTRGSSLQPTSPSVGSLSDNDTSSLTGHASLAGLWEQVAKIKASAFAERKKHNRNISVDRAFKTLSEEVGHFRRPADTSSQANTSVTDDAPPPLALLPQVAIQAPSSRTASDAKENEEEGFHRDTSTEPTSPPPPPRPAFAEAASFSEESDRGPPLRSRDTPAAVQSLIDQLQSLGTGRDSLTGTPEMAEVPGRGLDAGIAQSVWGGEGGSMSKSDKSYKRRSALRQSLGAFGNTHGDLGASVSMGRHSETSNLGEGLFSSSRPSSRPEPISFDLENPPKPRFSATHRSRNPRSKQSRHSSYIPSSSTRHDSHNPYAGHTPPLLPFLHPSLPSPASPHPPTTENIYERRIRDLEQALAAAETMIAAQERERVALRLHAQDAEHRASDVRLELAEAKSSLSYLYSTLRARTEERDRLSEECRLRDKELANLTAELRPAEEFQMALTIQLRDARSATAKAEAERDVALARVEHARKEIELEKEKADQARGLELVNAQLADQLREAYAKVSELAGSLERTKKGLDEAEGDRFALQHRVMLLNEQLGGARKQLAALTADFQEG
ncbi:hypothetical protein HK097_009427 [Rhizophlyctis rosea]|uniref:Uncharacterized protein n=1 Tax=Rhizophlyctis rosea TaxID=64517 RepID=A0AAD5SAK8_9FUNG|nr:hypothetical protein HK097_009427 [Rhizophlyctis rosea]